MIKSLKQTMAVCLLSAVAVGFTVPIQAQDKPAEKKPAAAAEAGKKEKPRGMPFNGKLNAVDKVAKTISIKGKEKDRVFHITSQTKFIKAGKPATLEDGVVGEEVGGFAREGAEGKLEAATVRFGPKPEGEGAKGAEKGEGKGKGKGKSEEKK